MLGERIPNQFGTQLFLSHISRCVA